MNVKKMTRSVDSSISNTATLFQESWVTGCSVKGKVKGWYLQNCVGAKGKTTFICGRCASTK